MQLTADARRKSFPTYRRGRATRIARGAGCALSLGRSDHLTQGLTLIGTQALRRALHAGRQRTRRSAAICAEGTTRSAIAALCHCSVIPAECGSASRTVMFPQGESFCCSKSRNSIHWLYFVERAIAGWTFGESKRGDWGSRRRRGARQVRRQRWFLPAVNGSTRRPGRGSSSPPDPSDYREKIVRRRGIDSFRSGSSSAEGVPY